MHTQIHRCIGCKIQNGHKSYFIFSPGETILYVTPYARFVFFCNSLVTQSIIFICFNKSTLFAQMTQQKNAIFYFTFYFSNIYFVNIPQGTKYYTKKKKNRHLTTFTTLIHHTHTTNTVSFLHIHLLLTLAFFLLTLSYSICRHIFYDLLCKLHPH